ncbi:hypothetical protein MHBO_001931 [Bonamia ostreae]|uniref:Uncharacterized protein n=1 Tax=Bonamia ostreae TaxID=126728 RepID=A0ABV2AKS2_9EUKA
MGGGWLPEITCDKTDCHSQPNVLNAIGVSLEECKNRNKTYVCNVKCLENFKLDGDNPVCQENGSYIPVSQCKGICKNNYLPTNGDASLSEKCEGKFVGESCDIKCLPEYLKLGNNSICNFSGETFEWSDLPKCFKIVDNHMFIIIPLVIAAIMGISIILAMIFLKADIKPEIYFIDDEIENETNVELQYADPEIKIEDIDYE